MVKVVEAMTVFILMVDATAVEVRAVDAQTVRRWRRRCGAAAVKRVGRLVVVRV